jgi:hypothetical protein
LALFWSISIAPLTPEKDNPKTGFNFILSLQGFFYPTVFWMKVRFIRASVTNGREFGQNANTRF